MDKSVFEILEKLEQTSGTNDKMAIVESNKRDLSLKRIFEYAYGTSWNFYVTASEEIEPSVCEVPFNQLWPMWEFIAERLNLRVLSGNAARSEVHNFLYKCQPLERKWMTRMINRDLRINVGNHIIKKVWPDIIQSVDFHLADAYKDTDVFQPSYIEPKWDGGRCGLFVPHNGMPTAYSRNGERYKHIEAFVANMILPKGYFYDGELFYKDWNNTRSIVSSGKGIENLQFFVFDILPIEDYEARRSKPLIERKIQLGDVFNEMIPNSFMVIGSMGLSDTLEGAIKLQKEYVKEGYEGAVGKIKDSLYAFKRSRVWFKLKDRDECTFLCIDAELGTGRNKNRLGKLTLQKEDGTTFKVGSGFSDKQRDEYWENKPIGKCIDIWLESSPTKVSKASFPVFVRVREDLGGNCYKPKGE